MIGTLHGIRISNQIVVIHVLIKIEYLAKTYICRKDVIRMKIEIDIGDLCTHCGRDTSPNSGNLLWVNRIPSGGDGEIVIPKWWKFAVREVQLVLQGGNPPHEDPPHISIELPLVVEVNGYMRVDCQLIECDICHKMVLDYELDGRVICSECMDKPKGGDENGT